MKDFFSIPESSVEHALRELSQYEIDSVDGLVEICDFIHDGATLAHRINTTKFGIYYREHNIYRKHCL